jgi:hypothetical protein
LFALYKKNNGFVWLSIVMAAVLLLFHVKKGQRISFFLTGKGSVLLVHLNFEFFLQVHLIAHRHLCFFSRQIDSSLSGLAHGLLQILKLKINTGNNSIHAPTNKLLTRDLGKKEKYLDRRIGE